MEKNMNRREFVKASAAATGAVLMAGNISLAFGEELKPIQLVSIHKPAILSWPVRQKTHGVESNDVGSISDRR